MIKNKNKKIIDVFPNWMSSGIFFYINQLDVPWTTNSTDLDLEYFGNHSGEKLISPLVSKLLNDDGVLASDDIQRLASVIYSMNIENWNRLYLAIQKEYDPLQNYNGVERREVFTDDTGTNIVVSKNTIEDTHTGTNNDIRSGSESVTSSGSDITTKTGTDGISNTSSSTSMKSGTNSDIRTGSESNNGSDTTNNKVFGFNSVSGVDDSSSDGTNNNTLTYNNVKDEHNINESDVVNEGGSSTTTYNTNDTIAYGKNDVHNYENIKDEHSFDESTKSTQDGNNTETRDLHNHVVDNFTREGNLGVTTSQQMLESEYLFRSKYRFFDTIFSDVDKSLCLLIY